jgi:hypothetical protein
MCIEPLKIRMIFSLETWVTISRVTQVYIQGCGVGTQNL